MANREKKNRGTMEKGRGDEEQHSNHYYTKLNKKKRDSHRKKNRLSKQKFS